MAVESFKRQAAGCVAVDRKMNEWNNGKSAEISEVCLGGSK